MRCTGRAGPICRRAFARLCKPKVNGTYSFWNPAGRPQGKRPETIVNVKVRKAVLAKRPVDLSKTAGAEARAKA
jgi:hypothetical protein